MWYGLLVVLCTSLCRTQQQPTEPTSCSRDGGCEEGGEGAPLSQFLQPQERLVQLVDSQTGVSGADQDVNMGDLLVRDIYFSVRTTLKYHAVRLPSIFLTWMQKVSPSQIHLVTERLMAGSDIWMEKATASGYLLLFSDCPTGHKRDDLCCKTGQELQRFYQEIEKYKWYCHFDDDVYVNVPTLAASLSKYDPHREWLYIGRWPLAASHMTVPENSFSERFPAHVKETYRYATGAAYCISVSLMGDFEEYLSGEGLGGHCKALKLPDDMAIGCLIEAVLGHNLTVDVTFTSNLNHMKYFRSDQLRHQSTVSYGTWTTIKDGQKAVIQNRLAIPGARFSEEEDPTRFFSYHCLLYPDTRWCRNEPD